MTDDKPQVWYWIGDRSNVIVTDIDPTSGDNFIDAVYACQTVADVKRLDALDPGSMEPALEAIEEDGLNDDDPWDYTQMPGYEEGDWPPAEHLGMADIFTDAQVEHLITHCDAWIDDELGGTGECLYIPAERIDEVGRLLAGWGYSPIRR